MLAACLVLVVIDGVEALLEYPRFGVTVLADVGGADDEPVRASMVQTRKCE